MRELQIVLSVLCAVVLAQLVVLMIRDRLPGPVTYALLALVEAGLVAQLVIGLAMVFDDHRGVSVGTYVGYLVGALVILPLAAAWAWAETGSPASGGATRRERTRSGTGVLVVAIVVLPVLFIRLHDIWSTHG